MCVCVGGVFDIYNRQKKLKTVGHGDPQTVYVYMYIYKQYMYICIKNTK